MNITIITHNLSRTGGSLVLLQKIIEELRDTFETVNVIALSGGELLPEYISTCDDVVVLDQNIWLRRFVTKLLRSDLIEHLLRFRFRLKPDDIVLVNTLVPICAVSERYLRKYRNFVWSHELDLSISANCRPGWSSVLQSAIYIPSSEPVRNCLERHNLNVHADLILPTSSSAIRVRAEKWKHRHYVIGVGTPSWHKGTDHFIRVAKACETIHGLKFAWIGGVMGSIDYLYFTHEASRLGVKNIEFIATTRDMSSWYDKALAVLVLSREESFGLPIVEAACHRVPSVVWLGSDGPQWIVDNIGGHTAPYDDLDTVALILSNLYEQQAPLADVSILQMKLDLFAEKSIEFAKAFGV